MLTEFRELFGYNDWANERVLGVVEKLTTDQLKQEIGGSFPSIWSTLTHIYLAERSWFIRWQGTPLGFVPGPVVATDLHDLREQWRVVADGRSRWLTEVTDDALRLPVGIILRSGATFDQQLAATMRHAVNHSTYHRGQITNFLRMVGAEAVGTDLVTYYREHPPA